MSIARRIGWNRQMGGAGDADLKPPADAYDLNTQDPHPDHPPPTLEQRFRAAEGREAEEPCLFRFPMP